MVGHFVLENLNRKSNAIWLSYITSDFQNALIPSNPLRNKKVIKQFSNPLNENSLCTDFQKQVHLTVQFNKNYIKIV